MENEDLSKLKIDKSKVVIRPRKKKKAMVAILGVIAIIVLVFFLPKGFSRPLSRSG